MSRDVGAGRYRVVPALHRPDEGVGREGEGGRVVGSVAQHTGQTHGGEGLKLGRAELVRIRVEEP